MKKNVVYILGAGFSAPMGIPVMREFVDKARQLKRGNHQFDYFENVIKLIQQTASAEKFFLHESGNIEEALSLLEMKDNLEGTNTKQELINFVVDVIIATTPKVPDFQIQQMPTREWPALFTLNRDWQGYIAFVASLFGLQFHEGTELGMRGIRAIRTNNDTEYSIISMNYDMLIENSCEFLQHHYWWEKNIPIQFQIGNNTSSNESSPQLVKIHGSVDKKEVIPPTYNKGLYGSELPQSWRNAYNILVKANHIRVLGYSLPQTDSYIKYLLMASIDKLKDLDRIDWIALDPSHELEDRFNQFITFRNKKFSNSNIKGYLESIFAHSVNVSASITTEQVSFTYLEQAHDEFMQKVK